MKKIVFLLLLLLPIVNSCEVSGDPELLELMLEIKNQNEELREELKSLQAKSDSILNSMKANEKNSALISNKLDQVQKELDKVLKELEALNVQMEKNNANVQELKAQMAELNKKYEAILAKLESLQLLQKLLSEVELIKNQITELEEKSDSMLNSIASTNSSLEQLKANIAQVRGDLEKVLSEISKLTISLSNSNSNIDMIIEQLSKLQNQCKALTELLESLLIAPKVGDVYKGGIVFYIDETSLHGLIVSKVNQRNSATEWGCYCEDIKNTKSEVGTGSSNTKEMLRQCTTSLSIPNWAAKIVDDLELEGFKDWYLPSKDELNLIYENLHLKNIGNFSTTVPYWSSTQAIYGSCGIAGGAWTKNFGNGQQIQEIKSGYQATGAVRAIRSF